jgi:hypothetical protein
MHPEVPNNLLHYQLTSQEAVAGLWRLFLLPKLIVSMVFIFLCGIGLLAIHPDRPQWAVFIILFPILFFVSYRRIVKRIISQHPELLETQSLSFDDSGFTISNSVTRIKWPWNRLREVIHRSDLYIFRFDSYGAGAIIPKRALNAEQTERILAYASTGVA